MLECLLSLYAPARRISAEVEGPDYAKPDYCLRFQSACERFLEPGAWDEVKTRFLLRALRMWADDCSGKTCAAGNMWSWYGYIWCPAEIQVGSPAKYVDFFGLELASAHLQVFLDALPQRDYFAVLSAFLEGVHMGSKNFEDVMDTVSSVGRTKCYDYDEVEKFTNIMALIWQTSLSREFLRRMFEKCLGFFEQIGDHVDSRVSRPCFAPFARFASRAFRHIVEADSVDSDDEGEGGSAAKEGEDSSAEGAGEDNSAEEDGDSSAEEGGDSSAEEGGDSSVEEGGDSSAAEGGDSSAAEGGDSSAAEGGDSSENEDAHADGEGEDPAPADEDTRDGPAVHSTGEDAGGDSVEDNVMDESMEETAGEDCDAAVQYRDAQDNVARFRTLCEANPEHPGVLLLPASDELLAKILAYGED